MKDQFKLQLRNVKKRFRNLKSSQREHMSVCILKVNLGVQSKEELQEVKDFLKDFPLKLAQGTLDIFIDFLHSDSKKLPHIVVTQDKKAQIRKTHVTIEAMPSYDEDDVDTLKEGKKPFK